MVVRGLVARRGQFLARVVVAGAAVVAFASIGGAASASASGTAWTGSGSGVTTVVQDGTTGPAEFTYSEVNEGYSGSWTFQTTAETAGAVELVWHYTGFHAFFQVTVGLSAFLTHDGSTTTTGLVPVGLPVDCCTAPSGGFDYSGTTTLDVQQGDTYGFRMSGSNFDTNQTLQGTLTVTPSSIVPPVTLTSAATASAAVGSTITDAATLAGSGGDSGSILFEAFAGSECAGTPAYSATMPATGDGTYAAPGFAPATAGLYTWRATYTGGSLVAGGACGGPAATTAVNAQPALTATATPYSEVGGTLTDTATLTGTGAGAGGTITFRAFADGACTTSPVHVQTVPVAGDGTYTDKSFAPSAPGTYVWTATYSGDPAAYTLGTTGLCGADGEQSVVTPANDAWTSATAIPLANGDGDASGELDVSGQARWYKVDVTPGGDVQVDLSNLPANYDLALFSDIGQAFGDLSASGGLTQVAAEFGADAFSPSVFSPSVFSPSVFSPSVFSPSVFSPSVFSPSVFSPSVFSPSVFSPSVFSPSVFSPSVFSPSVFSPSVFSPDPAIYEGAQVRSLLAISANDGTAAEHVFADVWNNTGSFYIRVNGRNGTYAPGRQFAIHVHENTGTCGGVQQSTAALLPGAVPGPGVKTVILTDYGRMTQGADLTAMTGKVSQLAAQTGGSVVDVSQSPRVAELQAQADAHTDCAYAENLVAGAIKGIVDAYRAASPGLQYVVIVGDDHVIPFFRYPDTAGLGPESGYVPPVLSTSSSEASLESNDVLSQDAYGSSKVLDYKGAELPLPDLPVGRLVESPSEISGLIDAYLGLANGVVPTPHSSLVTGYDFMTKGADAVESDLAAGLGAGARNDTLITNQGVAPADTGLPPDHSWTATQLQAQLLGARHDLVFLSGHFSANNTLAADYATTLNSTDLASSSVDLKNSIVFSAGCHSGYTIVDGDAVPGVTQPLDWTEAFAQKQATLIAGTGYQYGDTDFLAYSQQLYADFTHALRVGSGPVAVGSALTQAKAAYLAATPTLKGIDVKSILESTLYGLPMLSVDLPAGRIAQGTSSSIVSSTTPFATNPGAALGLSYFDHDFSPTLTTNTRQLLDPNGSTSGQPTATWLSGPDGVATAPGAPALPLATSDVSVSGGGVLRGVGFRGGTYSDQTGITPLTGAPATELNGVHSPFVSSAFFPSKVWSVNYFGGLTDSGGTNLMLTPVQYESDAPGSTTDVQRTFSNVSLRLFYSGNTSSYGANTPALAAPPTIARVDDTVSGSSVHFAVHVVGDPSAGIQQVWVTYAGVDAGRWESLDLAQDATDSTLWTGTLDGLSTAQESALRFVVQAANGVGLVSLDDGQGSYYRAGGIAPALQTATVTRTATSLALNAPAAGDYGTGVPVSATLTAAGVAETGKTVTFTLGATTAIAVTNASGVASATLPLIVAPGPYTLAASFDGDADLVDSAASAPFQVRPLATSLALTGGGTVVPGADTGVSAALTSGGVGLAQRTVEFVLTPASGAPVTQARTTDLDGRAALGTLAGVPAGTYAVSVYFGPATGIQLPADPVYLPSSAGPAQVTVLAATPAGLVSLVQTLSLDRHLTADLTAAANRAADQFGRNKQKQGCDALSAFDDRVWDGLAGPNGGPTVDQARELLALDAATEVAQGCLAPTSSLPAAEQSMLDVVGAIDDLPPAPGVRNVAGKAFMLLLRTGAIGVGRDAGRPGEATCVKLALLEKTASSGLARYLTAAQAGTIAPAIQVAEQQFSC